MVNARINLSADRPLVAINAVVTITGGKACQRISTGAMPGWLSSLNCTVVDRPMFGACKDLWLTIEKYLEPAPHNIGSLIKMHKLLDVYQIALSLEVSMLFASNLLRRFE